MRTAKFLHSLVIFLLLVTMIPLTPAIAQTSGTSDLLITYYRNPHNNDIQFIQSLGGAVLKVYRIVKVIHATVPSDKLGELSANPRVKLVEENITVQAASEVLPWGVDRIDAELVHPTNKGTDVKVAVLDSGIDLDHPDLTVAGNVTFVTGTTTGDDDYGHGTLVAGIIGALDNDIGVIGVAPEAALYAVKVLDSTGSGGVSAILSGIEWAVDNNMQVINMSFGTPMNFPSTVVNALTYANNAGIAIFAGAGNGGNADGTGENIWAPARYDSVIAVGATDENNNRVSTSSTGATLELMAPGNNIYSTAMGGGYGYIGETSASSPHAAGSAALLINAGMTNNFNVRETLKDSATDLGAAGWDSQYGWGLINVMNAINAIPSDLVEPATTISLSGTSGQNGWYISNAQVTLTASDTGGSGLAGTEYSLNDGLTWTNYSTPFNITVDGITPLRARSWDNAGNREVPPAVAEVMIDQTAPAGTAISPSGTTGQNGWYVSDVQVTITASDPNGSGLASTEYSLNGGAWNTYTAPFTITTEGITQVQARSTDNAGNVENPPASAEVKIDKEQITFSPAIIWVGLKTGNDDGAEFHLRAEVYKNESELIGSGEIGPVSGGSNGFNGSVQSSITLTPVPLSSLQTGDILSIKLLVKNAGVGHDYAVARLYYDGRIDKACSNFGITIASNVTYYLHGDSSDLTLSTTIGTRSPGRTIDAATNPSSFVEFGTWSITLP